MHNILLVEDNLGDALLLEEALGECDIDLTINTVYDGEEALEYLRKEGTYHNATTPDLVILDMNIPKKDGTEVFHEIRSDNKLAHHNVMILTSSPYEQDLLEKKELVPCCYVIKPSSLASFSVITETIMAFFNKKSKYMLMTNMIKIDHIS